MTDKPQTRQRHSVAPDSVIQFWFNELAPRDWFRKSARLDRDISARFGATLVAARAGETVRWRDQPGHRLAEILVLDQFSRNIHRDSARAFENDAAARALAREAISTGAHGLLSPQQRAFVYMPLMHSETMADHVAALALYQALGLDTHLDAERKHYAIIERFGRYPHRNAILGRDSSEQEIAFLAEPGSSF